MSLEHGEGCCIAWREGECDCGVGAYVRLKELKAYLTENMHNTNVLLLYPPLNAVAYRALALLDKPLEI